MSGHRPRSLGSNSPGDCCAREKKVLSSRPRGTAALFRTPQAGHVAERRRWRMQRGISECRGRKNRGTARSARRFFRAPQTGHVFDDMSLFCRLFKKVLSSRLRGTAAPFRAPQTGHVRERRTHTPSTRFRFLLPLPLRFSCNEMARKSPSLTRGGRETAPRSRSRLPTVPIG